MHNHKAALAVALSIVLASPAAGQLTSAERYKAEQLARIQATADAEEQARARRSRLDAAESLCRSSGRKWDDVTKTCTSRYPVRRPER
ncbi:hypothetical protein ACYZX9_18450 [Sphingomonas citri]